MCKNRRGSEGFLECFERGLTRVGPDKWCLLAGESGEGYDDFGVILDEASVEVGESEERLDFLDGTRDWPVSNDAGFFRIHCYAGGGDDESEVFNGIGVEGGFVQTGVKIVVAEALEDGADMFRVIFWVVGKDEDVVQVYDDVDVAQVLENVVHECLESSGTVRHPEGHDEVFVRAVTGPESRLPFVSFSDADVVVSGSEIDFGVDAGGAKAIKKVADEGDRIAVLLGDTIESAIVDAKPEGSVFLLREEDGGAGGRVGGTE